jgi:hypothetical protein
MKSFVLLGSLLMMGFALPGQAQQVSPEICSQHSTIYDPITGFCIYPDRPDVFTTTNSNILVDVREDSESQIYMVQAFDLAAQELMLAVLLDASRQPTRFLIGDPAMVANYQRQIDMGLDLLENWQPSRVVNADPSLLER